MYIQLPTKPPACEDYWIACFVLLSRVPNFEDLFLLRLPNRKLLSQPSPEQIRAAYTLFIQNEHAALRSLDTTLRHHNTNPHSFASPSYSRWTSPSAPRGQKSVSRWLRRARSLFQIHECRFSTCQSTHCKLQSLQV